MFCRVFEILLFGPFKSKDNYYQPEILQDDLVEHNHVSGNNYPTQMPVISSNKKLKCLKVPYVLMHHVPNKHTQLEEYAHHVYVLFI